MISRRSLVGSAIAAAGGFAAGNSIFDTASAGAPVLATPPIPATGGRTVRLNFDIAERSVTLPCFGGRALPLLTFGDADFPTLVRCRLGDTLSVAVTNGLKNPGDHVSIHWHGLRIKNSEDGVPYITQTPIAPGQSGRYNFAPPDTGTFFFHTHCNSVEHFGRGLAGVLIVDGDETLPFADDIPLVMMDWRIDANGRFQSFATDAGAAKGGTPGTVRSINGIAQPRFNVPSDQTVRLRFLNVDATRIAEIGFDGAAARVIAVDGNACEPFKLKSWRMGPAMRVDLAVDIPSSGKNFRLVDYFAPKPVPLATFASKPNTLGKAERPGGTLRRPRIAEPALASARRLSFDFSATATGQAIAELAVDGVPVGPLCLSKKSFWAINKRAWPAMENAMSGPPLAELEKGQTYIFELINRTPRMHPIHIHGHTFKWLASNLRTLPSHFADTVLLLPKERIEVAFVADNPGDWMFHCHVLEHQETGMMGYLRVR